MAALLRCCRVALSGGETRAASSEDFEPQNQTEDARSAESATALRLVNMWRLSC